ncbi:MAG TPA: CotH kinase family protein [Myxococcota bacterium]|nr:CotH kinase family protein [Myxococcota bacterium]
MSLLLALSACKPTVPALDPVEPQPELVYDHLLEVEIELDPDDWDELRLQSRDFFDILGGEDCQEESYGSPFTWFEGSVTLDGQRFERVDVRKKGFLGSLSEDKPALKLDLVEFEDQDFHGVERLTLNNSHSDPSLVRQCLGYGYFDDAGLPASRCGFATVSVNGDDLGLYVNVEPIKDPILERNFGDASGNLYELTLSDFRPEWTGTIEKKNNEAEDDWSDIDALVSALQVDDDELLDALDDVVDVEAFADHWAAEVLINHVDGYAWNTNNTYIYAAPGDGGRFRFIPWGIDEAFAQTEEGLPSVYAFGQLANRLYDHPEGRQIYLDAMNAQLAGPWDESVLLGRIDTWEELLEPELDSEERETVFESIEQVRGVVEGRRSDLEPALGEEWPYGQRDSFCMQLVGGIDASFDTWWGSIEMIDPFSTDNAELVVDLGDETFAPEETGAVAGWSEEGEPVLYLVSWISPTEILLVYFVAEPELFAPGVVEVDLDQSVAALFYYETETMEDFELLSYVLGDVEFEEAGTEDGDPLVGTMDAQLLTWGW